MQKGIGSDQKWQWCAEKSFAYFLVQKGIVYVGIRQHLSVKKFYFSYFLEILFMIRIAPNNYTSVLQNKKG